MMEQLAHFVTKTFEYNNNATNRVLEIINMTAKLDEKCDKIDGKSVENGVDSMDEDESVDIDITDVASEPEVKSPTPKILENCDKSCDKVPPTTNCGLIERATTSSPLPLIKKLNRDGTKHVTKNWLISDCPKKKVESQPKVDLSVPKFYITSADKHNDQENSAINLIRVEDLVGKKHAMGQFRAKPVNELLKQIREINNHSPLHNANDNFKVEVDDERIKAGEIQECEEMDEIVSF